MKKLVLAAILAGLVGSAAAEGITGNVSATTDYRFRGISQTQRSAAVQGGFDYSTKGGFYVGNWNSNVSSLAYTDSTGLESDIYGGYKTEIAKGITLDVGSYNYIYSRAHGHFNSASNTNEIYAGVGVGPAVFKYSQSMGEYFGVANSKNSKYVQADVNQAIAGKLTANAHIGRTLINNNSSKDYTDIKLGATYNVAGLDIGAHYYTNTAFGSTAKAVNTINSQQLYKNAVIVSVGKSF